MRKTLLRSVFVGAALSAVAALPAGAFEPVSPSGLQAEVTNGTIVRLSWEWGNSGEAVCKESFEADELPENWPTSDLFLPNDETSRVGNWMIYDFTEDERVLAHDGVKSAVLAIPVEDYFEDPTLYHQDEWLVVSPGEGAVYMDFWYYIYPELLEYGPIREFPDHYYVLISRDNGDTWTELWDARWDMGNVDDVQQASLFLGEPADENTLVAFRGVSGEEETLHFTWAVDDVAFYTAGQGEQRQLRARRNESLSKPAATASLPLYRKFSVPEGARRMTRALPEYEWLNAGNITFRIYVDDEIIGDYVKARYFTDATTKESGKHLYEVMAWSEAENREFAAAKLEVETKTPVFGAPRNIKAECRQQNDGSYTINAVWEAPEEGLNPSSYYVYINDKVFGYVDTAEDMDLSAGQSGLYKGYYTFGIEAHYDMPEGISERVYASVAAGTVPAPEQAVAEAGQNSVTLSWKHSRAEGPEPVAYTVSRGGKVLAETTAGMTFTDADVADGDYEYNVRARFDDGSLSLPAVARVTVGTPRPVALPYEVTFDSADMPDGWHTEMVDAFNNVKEMYGWRMDNWFGTAVPQGLGIDGGFASISGEAAGMNRLECYLVTPCFEIPDEGCTLTFNKYFSEETPGPSGAAKLLVQLSADDENWTDLAEIQELADGRLSLAIEGGKSPLRLRWGFLGRKSGVAAIDNVSLAKSSGVEEITAETTVDVYTVDGLTVARGISAAEAAELPSGLYLLRTSDGATRKLMLRR